MSLFAKDIKDKFDHSHGVLLELSDGRLSKLYDEREAHDLLKAHGFTNIRIQRVSRPDYVLDNLHVIAQRKKLE